MQSKRQQRRIRVGALSRASEYIKKQVMRRSLWAIIALMGIMVTACVDDAATEKDYVRGKKRNVSSVREVCEGVSC